MREDFFLKAAKLRGMKNEDRGREEIQKRRGMKNGEMRGRRMVKGGRG